MERAVQGTQPGGRLALQAAHVRCVATLEGRAGAGLLATGRCAPTARLAQCADRWSASPGRSATRRPPRPAIALFPAENSSSHGGPQERPGRGPEQGTCCDRPRGEAAPQPPQGGEQAQRDRSGGAHQQSQGPPDGGTAMRPAASADGGRSPVPARRPAAPSQVHVPVRCAGQGEAWRRLAAGARSSGRGGACRSPAPARWCTAGLTPPLPPPPVPGQAREAGARHHPRGRGARAL